MFKFNIHTFTVPAHYRDTHRCCCDTNAVVTHDLLRLKHHLHFFFRIAIIEKHINLGNHIEIDGVFICHRIFIGTAFHQFISFTHQLVHGFLTGTCHTLVSGYHDPVDLIFQMEWIERNHHLNGGTIGIGDDLIVFRQGISIDLRNHQFLGWVHPPCRRVINNRNSCGRKFWREFQGCRSTRRKQRYIRMCSNGIFGTHHLISLTPIYYFLADGGRRSNGDQFIHRKISFCQDLQHFCSNKACSAYYCYFHFDVFFIDWLKKRPSNLEGPDHYVDT